MIILQVKNYAKEDSIEEFIKYAGMLAEKSRQEKGCVSYQICQEQNNPANFTFIQQWESPDCLENYVKQDYFKELASKCAPLEDKPSEFIFYNVVA